MLTIPQEMINRMTNEHEPRTKQKSNERVRREGLYEASNQEIKTLGDEYEHQD